MLPQCIELWKGVRIQNFNYTLTNSIKAIMKIITSFLLILIFTFSCKSLDSPRVVELYSYDFSKYAEKNFLFTPDNYTGKYDGLGMLTVQIIPEITTKNPHNNLFKYYAEYNCWIGPIFPAEGIEKLYNQTVEMGGDCLCRFEVRFINIGQINEGVEISGYAIKRK